MFFIVNHENSIISADADFLESIGAKDIYEVALMIKNEEVQLHKEEKSIHYLDKSSAFLETPLSTIFGDTFLCEIDTDTEQPSEALSSYHEAFTPSTLVEEDLLSDDIEDTTPQEEVLSDEALKELFMEEEEEIISFREEPGEEEPEEKISTEIREKDISDLSDTEETEEEIFSLAITQEDVIDSPSEEPEIFKRDNEIPAPDTENPSLSLNTALGIASTDIIANTLLEDDDTHEDTSQWEQPPECDTETSGDPLFSLYDDTQKEEEEVDAHLVLKKEDEVLPESHTINTAEIAKLIGISEEEYIHFLDDFRNESSKLEKDLRGNNLKESREAITILKEASLLLHLPHIAEKLNELSSATSDEKENTISSYLKLLGATVIQPAAEASPIKVDLYEEVDDQLPTEIFKGTEVDSIDMLLDEEDDISDTPPFPTLKPEAPEVGQAYISGVESISLDDVQPIPFDFSINEAADELTLPASLVSEFIVDFINQAKENLPVLHKAYQGKDLNTIQNTAHMLKGASSNLRITPMADTLYNLQFNDDLEKVPELLEFFTGQLKALSIQMDQVS
jgi:HPt (histidine-containing phosphotransfer) domain-containing protein